MNYYTLSDEVLINAFAMIQTFEFNKEFSQSGIFGESYIMYPQGYEAKAFSYDAYLRLVIAEASGEPLQVEQSSETVSIYRRVLKNTSLFFGIFLLTNDVLSVYMIPCLKLAFLIMLFFISITLLTASAIKLELNIVSVIWKSIVAPLFSYFLVSVGFAWLVSLFMSNGASGVTEISLTISVGDPTTVIIIMIVINVAAMMLYLKICRNCFKDLKLYLISVADSIAATAIGAVNKMGRALFNVGRRPYRTVNQMSGGIPSTAKQRGSQNTTVVRTGMVAGGLGAAAVYGNNGNNKRLLSPAANKYDGAVKTAGQNIQPRKSRYDKLSASVDRAVDKADAVRRNAAYKAADGKAAFNDTSRGLRNRMAGGRDYITGSVARNVSSVRYSMTKGVSSGVHKVGTTAKGIGKSIDQATGSRISRTVDFVYGTKENRGLTNAQIDARNRREMATIRSNSVKKGIAGSSVVKSNTNRKAIRNKHAMV